MKKFGKFLFSTLSAAAAVGGIYCLYKKHVNKAADLDDFDDTDDDFEEDAEPENREYVSINITTETIPDDTSEDSETAGDSAGSETSAASESASAEKHPDSSETDAASDTFRTVSGTGQGTEV